MSAPQARNANPWWRRIQHAWQALMGRERHKSNDTRFLEFGGLRCKQVRFPDSAEAQRVEHLLRAHDARDLFPAFVFRLENTVWVRFVPGNRPSARNPADLDALCRFFTSMYRATTIEKSLEEIDLHERMLDKLKVLVKAGLLEAEKVEKLRIRADAIRPENVHCGLDYIDALAKNFIVGKRGVVGIDIEAIRHGELLGMGLAKARHRWLSTAADSFLDVLAGQGGPDLRPNWEYIRLQFLVHYSVQNLLRGKQRRVRAGDFDEFLSTGPS